MRRLRHDRRESSDSRRSGECATAAAGHQAVRRSTTILTASPETPLLRDPRDVDTPRVQPGGKPNRSGTTRRSAARRLFAASHRQLAILIVAAMALAFA